MSACFANQGPSQKRIRPAPMGRAFRVVKRTAHLTVKVAEKPSKVVVTSAPGTDADGATARPRRKGAAPSLHVEIDHPTTSSRHALLIASARPARIKLEDQGSTNGTFVAGQALERGRKVELRDGEVVRFGGFTVIVKIV